MKIFEVNVYFIEIKLKIALFPCQLIAVISDGNPVELYLELH